MWLAMDSSTLFYLSSNTRKNRSKRDMMGLEMFTLNLRDRDLSYLPMIGLAAARIEVLAIRVAWIPALASEIVYCSIASWIAT
jgi:hypothetical protein